MKGARRPIHPGLSPDQPFNGGWTGLRAAFHHGFARRKSFSSVRERPTRDPRSGLRRTRFDEAKGRLARPPRLQPEPVERFDRDPPRHLAEEIFPEGGREIGAARPRALPRLRLDVPLNLPEVERDRAEVHDDERAVAVEAVRIGEVMARLRKAVPPAFEDAVDEPVDEPERVDAVAEEVAEANGFVLKHPLPGEAQTTEEAPRNRADAHVAEHGVPPRDDPVGRFEKRGGLEEP